MPGSTVTTRYVLLAVIALWLARKQQVDACKQIGELLRGDAAMRTVLDMGSELRRFLAIERAVTHFRHEACAVTAAYSARRCGGSRAHGQLQPRLTQSRSRMRAR